MQTLAPSVSDRTCNLGDLLVKAAIAASRKEVFSSSASEKQLSIVIFAQKLKSTAQSDLTRVPGICCEL